MNPLESKIVETALSFVGQKEKPGNKGFFDTEFERLMRSNGWWTGAAWCALFGETVWTLAFREVAPEQLVHVKEMFSPMAVGTWFGAMKAGFKVSKVPKPGAVVIWRSGTKPIESVPPGHLGIVTKVLPSGDFETIEGNTGAAGGRDGDAGGDGVWKKTRKLDYKPAPGKLSLVGFVYPERG